MIRSHAGVYQVTTVALVGMDRQDGEIIRRILGGDTCHQVHNVIGAFSPKEASPRFWIR